MGLVLAVSEQVDAWRTYIVSIAARLLRAVGGVAVGKSSEVTPQRQIEQGASAMKLPLPLRGI
jgi:hypothetical protein